MYVCIKLFTKHEHKILNEEKKRKKKIFIRRFGWKMFFNLKNTQNVCVFFWCV